MLANRASALEIWPLTSSAAAVQGGRERLHGHNYQVSVWLRGVVGDDGYVVDFGELKKVIRALCK